MMDTNYMHNKPIKITEREPGKGKLIKELFEIEDETLNKKGKNKIKITYNEKVYFNPQTTNNSQENTDLNKFSNILNVFNNDTVDNQEISSILNSNSLLKDSGSSIKFNVNINNNYFNSNYNYVLPQENNNLGKSNDICNQTTGTGISGFLKKMFGFSGSNNQEVVSNNSNLDRNKRSTAPISHPDFMWDKRANGPSITRADKLQEAFSPHKVSFVPCINCNNMISLEEIETHSDNCVRVNDEVRTAEKSQFDYHSIDNRLRKLLDHLYFVKSNPNSYGNDKYYVSTLLDYISDAINLTQINHSSITNLKKVLTNIDTLSLTFKGSISTQILIERTRVLMNDKVTVFKEDLKRSMQVKKTNERKSGTIRNIKVVELEREKEEKLKRFEKLQNEKEMAITKVNNLKRSPSERNSISPNTTEEKEEFLISREYIETDNEELPNLNRRVRTRENIMEDINSDLDNISAKSGEISDCTSMSSSASAKTLGSLNLNIKPRHSDSNLNSNKSDSDDINSSDSVMPERKTQYQEFANLMLKIKFEKLHNSHNGHDVPEKVLFLESIKQNIPPSQWQIFIVNELKQPHKYSKYLKRDKKLKSIRILMNPPMDVIKEEN